MKDGAVHTIHVHWLIIVNRSLIEVIFAEVYRVPDTHQIASFDGHEKSLLVIRSPTLSVTQDRNTPLNKYKRKSYCKISKDCNEVWNTINCRWKNHPSFIINLCSMKNGAILYTLYMILNLRRAFVEWSFMLVCTGSETGLRGRTKEKRPSVYKRSTMIN